jgi:hypothetical protein
MSDNNIVVVIYQTHEEAEAGLDDIVQQAAGAMWQPAYRHIVAS